MTSFDKLDTVQFQTKMKPAALRIYQGLFPGCTILDLRERGAKVHILDKEFGIDSLLTTRRGQWFSIQEKYRRNNALHYLDFTQEYMNGCGTPGESPGEWFKLGAQLYFYGWANATESDFEKWAILDVARYKLLVEQHGGLEKIGSYQVNQHHGRASFFAIPIRILESVFVADYRHPQMLRRATRDL